MGRAFDIPVVATLDEALPSRPTALLLGTAPAGGKIPPAWRATILQSIEHGLDVVSGLHEFISRGPRVHRRGGHAPMSSSSTTASRPSEGSLRPVARTPGKHVILTVGTDCAIGKMSVSLELRKAALNAGLPASSSPAARRES